MKEMQEIQLNSYSYHNHHKLNLCEVIFTYKNNNYCYFYHYQVFKIKYRNLNTSNVCVLFYVGPSHSIFSIHTTLDQSIITINLSIFLPTSH